MDKYDIEKFSKAVERRAFEKNLLSHFTEDAGGVEFNKVNTKTFLDKPLPLNIVDNRLFYKDSNGDMHALDTSEGVTRGSVWLSDKLFSPPFDKYF